MEPQARCTRLVLSLLLGLALTTAAACSGSVPRGTTPTPEGGGAPTATPSPTATPVGPSPTPEPVNEPGTTPMPSPSPTSQPTVRISPTPTPSSETATPTATPSPTATASPTPIPTQTPSRTFGLFLEVFGLDEENVVHGEFLVIAGRTSPDAVVSVNGVIVPVDEFGDFEVRIALDPGPNLIDVVASDLGGNTESRTITAISIQE